MEPIQRSSQTIATGRHPSPTAVREPRSHPASLARGFDLRLHATRPARTMFAATSAAGVMPQRTRLVSSEPLVVNVSSNSACLGRGQSRPMRVLAPRGARLPPLGLEIIRSDNTDVAANEVHQITRFEILCHRRPPVALGSRAIAEISTSTPKEAICKCTAPTFTYWRRQPLAGDSDRV